MCPFLFPSHRSDGCGESPSARHRLGDAPPSQAPALAQEVDGDGGDWGGVSLGRRENAEWREGRGQLVWRKKRQEMSIRSPALRDRWVQEVLHTKRLAKNAE